MDHTPKPDQAIPIPSRKRKFIKVKEQISKLPDKKPHLDFIAALLTIPVLITVLVLNLTSLQSRNAVAKITPTVSITPIIQTSQSTNSSGTIKTSNTTPVAITTEPKATVNPDICTKDIGPIDIASPQEGEIVTSNSVCIVINYQQGNYCSVVWAYKVNDSNLSDYSNNSVCLSNLPSGKNTFTLQVKSLVSPKMQTIQRNFFYKTTTTPSPTPSITPSLTPASQTQ